MGGIASPTLRKVVLHVLNLPVQTRLSRGQRGALGSWDTPFSPRRPLLHRRPRNVGQLLLGGQEALGLVLQARRLLLSLEAKPLLASHAKLAVVATRRIATPLAAARLVAAAAPARVPAGEEAWVGSRYPPER